MAALKRKDYESLLEPLQLELNNLAHWLQHTGRRMVVLFEGRDAAGKGGVINAITKERNPRQVRVVGLAKPTEREQTQWYFQRYIAHLPSAGEMVLFDRSWYNRAGVEHVMGFCTREEYRRFLEQAPVFERMLVDDGILLYKYWLAVDQRHQEERFAERAADPLKRWKLSPIDIKARERYVEYGRARDAMFKATHTQARALVRRELRRPAPGTPEPDPPPARSRARHARCPRRRSRCPRWPASRRKERFRGPVKPIRERY